MKARGQKSQFSSFSVNWKIWKCNLGFSKVPISHLLCPNLGATVENKMGNSQKRGRSHFKLKINDRDIPFPKILRICQ